MSQRVARLCGHVVARGTSRSVSTSAASEPYVKLSKSPTGVATISLARPKILNAMTAEMGDEFKSIIADLKNDPNIRAVILTGEGRAFSAGGELETLLTRTKNTPMHNSTYMKKFYARFLSVRDLPVPVIAAINGHAIGAGLCVTLACDIRIASEKAKLGFTFVNLGLHPGMAATRLLPAIVGPERAARMLLTGEVITGREAERVNLVSEAVPAGDVLKRATELAETIAQKSSVSIRGLTRSLRMNTDFELERALQREADAQALCYADPQFATDITKRLNEISSARKNKK